MYRQSIVLLQNQTLARIARTVLEYKDRHAEKELALLRDLNEIAMDILQTGNTSNIRRQLGTFIMQKGFPFLTMIDFRVDLGLPKEKDPDNLKLFRTFIISFVLLAHTRGYEGKTANIILFASKEDTAHIRKWVEDPTLLFGAVKTEDEKLNAYISSFASDSAKAKRYFHLLAMEYPAEGELPVSIKQMETVVQDVEKWLISQKHIGNDKIGLVTDDVSPASVMLRANMEKIVVDGKVRDVNNDEKLTYGEMSLHLIGAVTVRTFETVKKRIVDTLASAQRIKPFRKDVQLVIKVPDASLIDASFATNFGMFLSNVAGGIKIVLDLGRGNLEKLRNSSGFIAVKGHILNRF